jgi:hypothetical protein
MYHTIKAVFNLELHDTPEGEEDISDDDYFEPEADEQVCIVFDFETK